jgi:hypothetical protein
MHCVKLHQSQRLELPGHTITRQSIESSSVYFEDIFKKFVSPTSTMGENCEVSLSDKYVNLLENVIKENAQLRQVFQERDEQQQLLLKRLDDRLGEVQEPVSKAPKKRKISKVSVPQRCRVSLSVNYESDPSSTSSFFSHLLTLDGFHSIMMYVSLQILSK